MKTLSFMICPTVIRKSQKSKQVVKQLYGRKTKTAPNKPVDSL